MEQQGRFEDETWCFGFELEGWITDSNYHPAGRILDLMQGVDGDALVPELAAFNFELNGAPVTLQAGLFAQFESNLRKSWRLAAGGRARRSAGPAFADDRCIAHAEAGRPGGREYVALTTLSRIKPAGVCHARQSGIAVGN